LFIDEVLAVGDFRFRQKCLARIREMRARSAFVFVSHSMHDISHFCDRALVLHKGQKIFDGPPQEAIELYESLTSDAPVTAAPPLVVKAMGPKFANESVLSNVEHYWCDANGDPIEEIEFDDPIRLKIKFRTSISLRNLNIGVPVWNLNASYTTGLSTEITLDKFSVRAGEAVEFILEVESGILNPGTLKSVVGVVDGVEFLYRQPNPDLVVRKTTHPTWGAVTIPHRWRRIVRATHAAKASDGT
jgi:ABC-type glutathione transport system ATPase component